jgi:UDP-N-acetylglucosamine 1-carboxyvinyltransferase
LEDSLAKYIVTKSEPLQGEVVISGSKNAVLPILAAALLSEQRCEIYDVPALKDVDIMCDMLRELGSDVIEDLEANQVIIESGKISTHIASYELVKKMRASILVMGPLLARIGKAEITLPGGCAIGDRPVELHFKCLRALGAEIVIDNEGTVHATAEQLTGASIYLDFPSVGATENLMMAASLANGITILENAAQEPEIVDLANFLNKMGAKIKGAGTDTIKIEGVEQLHGASHNVIPDRIEAGTFMVAAAITRGNVLLKNVLPDHLKPIIAKLRECGVEVSIEEDDIRVRADRTIITSTDIKTLPYPGFPTDMQPQFMSMLCTAEGSSVVIETVFENRYMHVSELNRMGANIKTEDRCAIITGKKQLKGASVIATDLRAGAAVVLAGLVAEGTTSVSEIYHIERGYERFVEKLSQLGGLITKVKEEQS